MSAAHGGRRGIRRLPDGRLSLLLDYGLSGYLNFWDGEVLHYLGDGVTGDQVLTPATALGLDALHGGTPARVWERLRPNVWYDLGWFRFAGVTRREVGGRQVFDFSLRQETPPPGHGG
ncbi:hypothetical protein [Deinococcus pimensis]|uniref:hypothetical protein n=1 Tax=Deinococcus pimensis TaxID=309888 RepID=UPI0004BBA25C|nr:hypothetical protein [Deinococcus pimensis]